MLITPSRLACRLVFINALWEIFNETFKQQGVSLEGATYQWQDGALPALQETCVFTQIDESGKLRLSIANPEDDRYRGTQVLPTPAAD